MNATTMKPGNNPATKTPAKKSAPKMAGGLTYPSPLLGVPNPATASRSIEIVFDGRTKTKRGILATERQRLQIAAAGKIVAMAAEERRERAESATIYKGDVDAAERAYTIAVRAAQSARDIALANAKEDRDIRTAQSTQAFSAASEPVERDLKSSIYMLDTAADEELATLAEEFRIYHAAAVAMEAAREAERKAKAAESGPVEKAVEALSGEESPTAKAKAVETVNATLADLDVLPVANAPDGTLIVRKRGKEKAVDSDALLRPEQKEALTMLANAKPRWAPKATKKTATKAPAESV